MMEDTGGDPRFEILPQRPSSAFKKNCRVYMVHNPQGLRACLSHHEAFGITERDILLHRQEAERDGGQQAHQPLGIDCLHSPLLRIDSSLILSERWQKTQSYHHAPGVNGVPYRAR